MFIISWHKCSLNTVQFSLVHSIISLQWAIWIDLSNVTNWFLQIQQFSFSATHSVIPLLSTPQGEINVSNSIIIYHCSQPAFLDFLMFLFFFCRLGILSLVSLHHDLRFFIFWWSAPTPTKINFLDNQIVQSQKIFYDEGSPAGLVWYLISNWNISLMERDGNINKNYLATISKT